MTCSRFYHIYYYQKSYNNWLIHLATSSSPLEEGWGSLAQNAAAFIFYIHNSLLVCWIGVLLFDIQRFVILLRNSTNPLKVFPLNFFKYPLRDLHLVRPDYILALRETRKSNNCKTDKSSIYEKTRT